MEIHSLSLRVTQEEINGYLTRAVGSMPELRGLAAEIGPAGIALKAEYFAEVFGFGTWVGVTADLEVGADGGYLGVRLVDVKAIGSVPVKSMVLGKLAKIQADGVIVENDTIVVNLERLLETTGVAITLNLSEVRLEPGALVLVAQGPAGRVPAAP